MVNTFFIAHLCIFCQNFHIICEILTNISSCFCAQKGISVAQVVHFIQQNQKNFVNFDE